MFKILLLIIFTPSHSSKVNLNGSSGYFFSPNFPSIYDANRNCTWNITVPNGKIIKLTFLNFTLVKNENTDCSGAAATSARVFITNVASHGGDPNDFKLCGHKLPNPVYSKGNFIQVRFESRTGPVNRGFKASFEAIDGDSLCPTDMILGDTAGSFSSPFYPRNYPFNQTCSWKIIGKQGYRVELTIPDYNLHQCDAACSCDYVEVQNSFSDNFQAGKLCGTPRNVNLKFYSLQESLRVVFVSDDTKMDYDGFEAMYKLLNYSPPICPKEAIPLSTSGKISSTNYPKSNYTASRSCTWNITAPADKIVMFVFTDFVLSECSANYCLDNCSYVELYDGGSITSRSLGRFCQGSPWKEPQFSSGNRMFVMFHPGQTIDRGFEAEYERTTIACTPPGESINVSSGHISSLNFPNSYDANRICTWNITVPSGNIIKLTFLSFTLVIYENTDCSGADSTSARVFITNVASHGGSPNDFKLCGQKLPPPVYSKGNFIQVRFESRTGLVNKGFNVSFEAIDGDSLCPTGMILGDTTGSFSSPFYPRNYPFNQTCSWKIIGKQGYRVELTIPDYNLHQCDAACSCDYVEVQNSSSNDGKLCGTRRNVNLKFYSLQESLRVVFVSDDTKMDYNGFGATYKLLNYSPPIKRCHQRKPDLVGAIYGGNEVIRGINENITMNASLSYDPDIGQGNHSGMSFTWYNGEIKSNISPRGRNTKDVLTGVRESSIHYTRTASGIYVILNTAAMALNKTYIVKLVVTKDCRNASAYQTIYLEKTSPLQLSQSFLINHELKVVSPSVKLSVQAQCQGSQCSKISSYEWILHQQYKQNSSIVWRKHDLQPITDTLLGSSYIVIKGGSLTGGENYRLTLFATTRDGLSGMSAYDFATASPPTGGTCGVTPSSGISLKTYFNLTCIDWKSDQNPLSYKFQYQLENGVYSMVYQGLNSSVITWLPSGNMSTNYSTELIFTVSDKVGASAPAVYLSVKVKPPQYLGIENVSNILTANDSSFNEAIKNGDLDKAAQIANSALRLISSDTNADSQEKAKIQDFVIQKIVSLKVKSIPELLQSSSVIFSALQVSERVSHESLESSLTAVRSMTSLFWSTSHSKNVTDIPLVPQAAHNLASCLDNVLKAGSVSASSDRSSNLREQGKSLVNTSMNVLSKVSAAVLALKVPDENITSITTRNLSLTLGRHTPQKLAGLMIKGENGRPGTFILPSDTRTLVPENSGTHFIDIQMMSILFNPYTWSSTKERVTSDVLVLNLKNDKSELLRVSNLAQDIVIVTPLKPQTTSMEKSWYFIKNEKLRFHEINVTYANTLLRLEILPQDPTTHLFVYIRFGQRPTTQEYDLNATVSHNGSCVWKPATHGKKKEKKECGLNPLTPIETLAEHPGKYFLGLKAYVNLAISRKRDKGLDFGTRQRKSLSAGDRGTLPTQPQGKNVPVDPVYDSTTDQNYTLRVALGSCVYWSDKLEMWITSGCQILAATDGFINCSCNHLTAFGGSLLIKPNPIDFDKLRAEFEKLPETGNIAVIVTVAAIVFSYTIVLIIVRRADKKDAKDHGLPIQLSAPSNSTYVYEIVITTGVWKNSGTTAQVAMEIYGSDGKSGIIRLCQEELSVDDMLFSRGNSDLFVLNVNNSLGAIREVQIGHNNSGDSPSWFLEKIVIRDLQSNQSWKFIVSQWFALERGDGRIERIFDLTAAQPIFSSEVARLWQRGLAQSHIWISVAAKPRRSHFTRVQRVSCCLLFLLTSMFANAMFYNLDGKYEQPIQVGPLKFSWRQIITGIESALVGTPINLLIVFLFQKGAKMSTSNNSHSSKLFLIHGISWFLLFSSCFVSATFTVIYSLIWEKTVSEQWLFSMFVSLAQDVTVTEPVKVFFTALVLAAIFKIKAKRSEVHECENSNQSKSGCSKERFWTLKLSDVERMRRRQAKKENLSRYFTELIIYSVFVFLLMVVCYGNRNDRRYQMTKSIRDGLPNFGNVANDKMYWSWLQDVFIPGVFSGRWYNGQEEKQTMYIGNKHSIHVGMARLRQLRVKSTSCNVPRFQECYKGYSSTDEVTTACFKPGWKPFDNSTSNDELPRLCPKPWRYQNAKDTDTVPKWGQFSFYNGGGFVADLGFKNHMGFSMVTNLRNNNWLDKQTRVVIAEFSMFNPSLNILGIGTYFYEVEASGYKAPSSQIDVISLNSSDTASLQFYLICLFLFIVCVILYFGRETLRLYKHRSRYFQSLWNWLEMFQVVFSVLTVVIYLIRQRKVNTAMRKLQENIDANISFQEAITWQEADNAALGVLMFIVSTKLLRIIRLNSQVAVFSKALKISARSLSSFSVILLTFFIAFLHFGILMFCTGSERYSSVLQATYFQLELTLGRVKARPINELSETHSIYAKIFSFLILLTLTILCMNFFIGMINDALLEAKNTAGQSVLHELVNEDHCTSSKETRAFFDVISHRLRQSKVSQALDGVEKTFSSNSGPDFKSSSKIIILREQKVEKEPSNVKRKSFFDKTSRMLKALKSLNYDEQSKAKDRENVRLREDVGDSFLQKLDKKRNDLFQHLDRVISGFSEEEEYANYFLNYIGYLLGPRC